MELCPVSPLTILQTNSAFPEWLQGDMGIHANCPRQNKDSHSEMEPTAFWILVFLLCGAKTPPWTWEMPRRELGKFGQESTWDVNTNHRRWELKFNVHPFCLHSRAWRSNPNLGGWGPTRKMNEFLLCSPSGPLPPAQKQKHSLGSSGPQAERSLWWQKYQRCVLMFWKPYKTRPTPVRQGSL